MKVKVTGPAAVVVLLFNLMLMVWSIYFTIKIAAHVGAFPFG